jgi:flagellar hook protein FlgE
MYSGVAGMKAHQARMDVIGNNIANVNTYGFKSGRASFKDIYYQTLQGASGATSDKGGTNPSQIGYGVQLGGVSVNQSRSSFAMTDIGMDVAIAGEGFFQVQDGDGNIFFTRTGMLDIDTSGNLVDSNGNFVLGVTGNPLGQAAGKDRIRISIPSVSPTPASVTETINNNKFTITSSNKNSDANVAFTFVSEELPEGKLASATITTTGITVKLSADASFKNITEVNDAINAAITEANGGKVHPGGIFTISTEPTNLFGKAAVAGDIRGTLGNKIGSITLNDNKTTLFGGMAIKNISSKFTAEGNLTFSALPDVNVPPTAWTISATDGTCTYSGTINSALLDSDLKLQMSDPAGEANTEYITLSQPGLAALNTAYTADPTKFNNVAAQAVATKTFLGGMTIQGVSNNFVGSGAMTFSSSYDAVNHKWLITASDSSSPIKNYTGEIAQDASAGTLRLSNSVDGDYIEMNCPSFAAVNATIGVYAGEPTGASLNNGLANLSAVAFTPAVSIPLTGAEIISADFSIAPGTMSGMPDIGIFGGLHFKNTSADFTGSGVVTVKDAVYTAEDNSATPAAKAFWTITMSIGGKDYVGKVTDGKTGDVYLTNITDGDQIILSNPGFEAVTDEFQGDAVDLITGSIISPSATGSTITATAAQLSKALGLGSKNIILNGGTEGGAQNVADLSSITIGADGVLEAVHAVHGRIQVGRIDLAVFQNAQGLEQAGNTYFKETANSGNAKQVIAGTSGSGALASGSLEQSNVDLSSEFSDMITTQRGFQANSRMITVSDTMLEELVNLKR